MLARALDAGVPARWCTTDEFYGGDQHLRRDLQGCGVGYVLAVAKSHRVTARAVDGPVRADRLAATLPTRVWNRISAGAGSKGDRDYDWAWITITTPGAEANGCHSLLVRRRISDGELAFYRCWSPRPVPLHTLVRVAGTRWNVETCFQTGKSIGLDEHQVRRWNSWYRHITLAMLAHAILTVIAARERDRHTDHVPIPLTLNEIRRIQPANHQHHPHDRPLAALVSLAPPAPSQGNDQPLPPPLPSSSINSHLQTNPACRIEQGSPGTGCIEGSRRT